MVSTVTLTMFTIFSPLKSLICLFLLKPKSPLLLIARIFNALAMFFIITSALELGCALSFTQASQPPVSQSLSWAVLVTNFYGSKSLSRSILKFIVLSTVRQIVLTLKLSSLISPLLLKHSFNVFNCEIILLGDFNIHNAEWLTYSRGTIRAGIEAENFAIINGLFQLITSPTRIPERPNDSANTLDLVLTSEPNLYKSVSVTAAIGSYDHNLITITHPHNPFDRSPKPKRKLWNYSKADWSELRNFFSCFPWKEITLSNDPSASALAISEIILLGMDLFIPFTNTTGTSSSSSWFIHQCAAAIQEKIRLFQAWHSSRSEVFRQAYVVARNSCHTLIDETKNSFILHIANKLTVCPTGGRSFWSLAKSVSSNFCSSKFPPLENPDGSLASDAPSKVYIFARLFPSNSDHSPPFSPAFL